MIVTPENDERLGDYYFYLRTLKTTSLVSQWIDEEKEDDVCDRFNVGPGDVYRYVDTTQRLLYAAGAIADLQHKKKMTFDWENLKMRVRYGIKEELLDLVKLRNVGRVRARQLFHAGYKTIASLKTATVADLARIPTIGNSLANEILAQVR